MLDSSVSRSFDLATGAGGEQSQHPSLIDPPCEYFITSYYLDSDNVYFFIHMLFDHPRWCDITHLGEVISTGRHSGFTRTLYLSAGLADTEVVALDAAISHKEQAP